MGDREGQEIEKQEMITDILVQDTQDSKCYTLKYCFLILSHQYFLHVLFLGSMF